MKFVSGMIYLDQKFHHLLYKYSLSCEDGGIAMLQTGKPQSYASSKQRLTDSQGRKVELLGLLKIETPQTF